jgi:hypothetical protein
MSEMEEKLKKYAKKIRVIHEIYIGSILISIIIILSSYNFSENANLTNYLSFALTVSSLLLALVAIGMTLVGNINIERQFDKISETNMEVRKSSFDIGKTSGELNKQLEILSVYVKDIGEKIEENSTTIKEITEKAFINSLPPGPPNLRTSNEGAHIDFEEFWHNTSFSGVMLLYAVTFYAENGLKFDLKTFSEKTNDGEFDNFLYYHGFFIACLSVGMISVNRTENVYMFSIMKVNFWSHEDLELKILEKIKLFEDSDDEAKNSYKKFFGNLKTYLIQEKSKINK